MAHMLLSGAGYASLPDSADLDETDILDIRAEIDLDAYSGGLTQSLVCRWTSGAQRLWQFYLSNARGTFTFRDAVGTQDTPQADADFTLTPGTPSQVRLRVDAPNQQATYYQRAVGTALTADSGWSQVGSVIATTNTDIRTGFPIVEFGSAANGTLGFAAGKYYRGVIKKGAGGTLIVDADPSDTSTWDCPDKLFFTEKASAGVVTLQGDAQLVGSCPSSGNRMGGTGAIRKPPRYTP